MMTWLDKENSDHYLSEVQLDEIVSKYVQTPIDESDRELKMMVLKLVCDVRNFREENERLLDELADKKGHIEGLKTARDRAIEMHEADIVETFDQLWAKDEEIKRIREDNAKLVKALEWYASFWNHEVQLEHVGVTSMQRDNGSRARSVLSEIKGENHQ